MGKKTDAGYQGDAVPHGLKAKVVFLICGHFNGRLDDGGTASFHGLLAELVKRGADCRIEVLYGPNDAGCLRKYAARAGEWKISGRILERENDLSFCLKGIPVNVRFVEPDIFKLYRRREDGTAENLVAAAAKRLQELQSDIVLTGQEDIFSLKAAAASGCGCFHVISSNHFKFLDVFRSYARDFAEAFKKAVIITRPPLKADIKRLWGQDAWVLPSIIDYEAYAAGEKDRTHITLVHYTPAKGGAIFWNIARKMPESQFLVVDQDDLFRPHPQMQNVTVLPWEPDMRKVYDRTKILLVPSLVEESYCRVVAEGLANGIPVIANRVGGIRELWEDAVSLVEVNEEDKDKKDYFINSLYHTDTYEEYIRLIRRLEADPVIWARASEKALKKAREIRETQDKALDDFARILGESCGKRTNSLNGISQRSF